MKAIVLAGGFGTRIQPLTNGMPKPMLPILNRPMMEHTMIKLRDELGIKDVAVLLYFMPDVIKSYFKDGAELGMNISYYLPDDDYGTAGAVGFAREFLDETFIIVSGDLVTNFKFDEIYDFHKAKKSKLTISLTPVENPLQFGVVIANKEGKIQKFLEKPSWGEVFSDTINTGIYIIEPEILNYIPVKSNYDFGKDLFPTLMKNDVTLWGCYTEGYWRDVGNPESYRDVYQDIYDGIIDLKIKGEKREVDGGLLFVDEGSFVDESVKIQGLAIVGKNSKIEGAVGLSNCVIGDNCVISDNVKISNSVIWNDCKMGSKSLINNSIVCNDVEFDKNIKIKSGLIIAEKCVVEQNVTFERDVMVWPNKTIQEGSSINTNVIWGDKYKAAMFGAGSVSGRANIELSSDLALKLAESFGSVLPVGSKVYVSRDYHNSSRMLKRAFLSGLLSTGINVVDVFSVPSVVMRHDLANNDDIVAGVHIRQSAKNLEETEILFYTSEGLLIDTNFAKNMERVFTRENFRRVRSSEIGYITEDAQLADRYITAVKAKINNQILKTKGLKIATNLMFGSISNVYPKIANELGVESVILNAYEDDKQLQNLAATIQRSQAEVSKIVTALGLDCGVLIYPNGQKLQLIDDEGNLVKDYVMLLAMLEMLNSDPASKGKKVFLPAWAPDFTSYDNIEVIRGKFGGFRAKQLQDYDLIATTDGHFAFSEFGLNTDAVFSSTKVLELLISSGSKLSDIINKVPNFVYRGENVACPSAFKGKMMRKFLEDGKDKKSSHLDGVKIWVSEKEWILMIPDQHSEFLNIYIQALNHDNANAIFGDYKAKIDSWINE